jgi:hypothetical protein
LACPAARPLNHPLPVVIADHLVLRARHENATVALGSASAKRRGVPEQAGRAEPVQARAARTPSPEPGVSKLLSHSVEGVAARLAAASRKRGQSQRPWNPAFAGGCRENPGETAGSRLKVVSEIGHVMLAGCPSVPTPLRPVALTPNSASAERLFGDGYSRQPRREAGTMPSLPPSMRASTPASSCALRETELSPASHPGAFPGRR